jgi:transcriptional regulator with XRE-family HTH domain
MQDQLSSEAFRTAPFGARLRALRVRAGLSQEALAARAGLGVTTLKALEHGQRQRPHPRTLALLADALELAPAERDALDQSSHSGASADQAAGVAETVPPGPPALDPPQLPVWLTSFVGREAEVEAVRALLDPAHSTVRLLTLLGPGGVGKTRLAVTAAGGLTSANPDGVVFVDLAPLSDARLVPATVARALGCGRAAGVAPASCCWSTSQPQQALLVVDNFEHLLSAAPLLAQVVRACSRIALLITSRTALRLQGERRFNLRPLPTPDTKHATVAELQDSAAVRLFAQRAQAVASDFELEPCGRPSADRFHPPSSRCSTAGSRRRARPCLPSTPSGRGRMVGNCPRRRRWRPRWR